MDKGLQHRLARLLRVAVSWCVAFHGSLMPRAIGTLYAQQYGRYDFHWCHSDEQCASRQHHRFIGLRQSERGRTNFYHLDGAARKCRRLPDAQLAGRGLQRPVRYLQRRQFGRRYECLVEPAAGINTALLQAPSFPPKNPGQTETYGISGLIPGDTYYFGIKSISMGGITSPIDTRNRPRRLLQAKAVATKIPTNTGNPPLRPNGLSTSDDGGIFKLMWHPVTLDTSFQSITIDHYLVYRYDDIGSSPTVTATVPAEPADRLTATRSAARSSITASSPSRREERYRRPPITSIPHRKPTATRLLPTTSTRAWCCPERCSP